MSVQRLDFHSSTSHFFATLCERISLSVMSSRRMNDGRGSDNRRSGDTAEEDLPTHGTGMLSEPQGTFLQLAACVIAVSLDPFFLYIPVINDHEKCFLFDNKLRIAALVLRSVADFIFVLHIAFRFRTGYVARYHRVNEKVASSWEILKTYMLSYFLIDILSLLPLPQVVMLSILPKLKGSKSQIAKNILIALALSQYIPRVVRIYPLYKKLTWTPRIFMGTLWTKAVFNLFLYILASHVLGALWYFFSIEREITCWQEACKGHPRCDHSSFFCDDGIRATELLHDMCPIDPPNTNLFDFGIFLDALQSHIVESVDLPQKLFRCLWWGLQNLSSLGQNLKTSTYVWENIFAVSISISGLVLFLHFIGKMQTYMQLKTIKKEEKRMEIRSKKIEIRSKEVALDSWMSTNRLPKRLKSRIKHSVEKKWHEIRTVDSENLIPILPVDLQKDVKRFLCRDLVMRVSEFQSMDHRLLDAMCDCMKPVSYSKEYYIVQEGDQVKEMCLIFRGKVLSHSTPTNAGINFLRLQTGDFCGKELLDWASRGCPPDNFPVSNRTAQARTEVEAFVLTSEGLKVAIETWAALVIQKAWQRHSERNPEALLPLQGATLYVSRFTHALGLIRGGSPKWPIRQKPAELEFPAEGSSS